MAEHAYSIPAPNAARPPSVWRIKSLMDLARASHIAVQSEDAVQALCVIEGQLWHRLALAPTRTPLDARGKLEAVLEELVARRDIDHVSAGIVRDVADWLDGVVLS